MISLQDFGVTRQVGYTQSGIRVVLFKRTGMPIAMQVNFAKGSKFDPVGKEGLAHFVEHMLLAGTTKFPSKDKLTMQIENLGGQISAGTSSSRLSVTIEIADPGDLNDACNLLHQVFCESLFLPETVESERGSILRERALIESNPSSMVNDLYDQLVFHGTSIGRSTIGTPETILSITRDDLYDFKASLLDTRAVSIVVSGDITIERLLDELNGTLCLAPTQEGRIHVPLSEESIASHVVSKQYPSLDQIPFVLGFKTCPLIHEDHVVLSIIATLLGGGRASTLNRLLRYERGLVYGCAAYARGLADVGTLLVTSSTQVKSLPLVLSIISSEFRRTAHEGITQAELDFAKNKLVKSTKRDMQQSMSWVNRHSLGELIAPDKYLPLDAFLNRVLSTTEMDVKRIASKYFRADNVYLAHCGDFTEDVLNDLF